jgi:hypothetical protein
MDDADRIRNAIQEVLADDHPDGDEGPFLIGDLVLIAEVTDQDGSINLFTLHNTDITRWKEIGFLHDRLSEITNEGHFELGVKEED